ncbi:unnamed protein product [Lota lota]
MNGFVNGMQKPFPFRLAPLCCPPRTLTLTLTGMRRRRRSEIRVFCIQEIRGLHLMQMQMQTRLRSY